MKSLYLVLFVLALALVSVGGLTVFAQGVPIPTPRYGWVATAGGPGPYGYVATAGFYGYVPTAPVVWTPWPTWTPPPAPVMPTAIPATWIVVWMQADAILYTCPSTACPFVPPTTLAKWQYVTVREAGVGWYQVEDQGVARWATGLYFPAWTARR